MPNDDLIFTSLDALGEEDDLVFTSLDGIKQKQPSKPKLPANMNPQQVKRYFSNAGVTLTDTQTRDIAGMVSGKSMEEAMSLAANYLRPKVAEPVQEEVDNSVIPSSFQPMPKPEEDYRIGVSAPKPGTQYTGEPAGINLERPDFTFNTIGRELARPKSQEEINMNISQTMIDEYKEADKDLEWIFDAIDNGKIPGAEVSALGEYTGAKPLEIKIEGLTGPEIAKLSQPEREQLKIAVRRNHSARGTVDYISSYATIKSLQEESTKNMFNLTTEVTKMLGDPQADKALLRKKQQELSDQIIINRVSNETQKSFNEKQRLKSIADAQAAINALSYPSQAYIAAKNVALAVPDIFYTITNTIGEALNKQFGTSNFEKQLIRDSQSGKIKPGSILYQDPNKRVTTEVGESLKQFSATGKEDLENYRKSSPIEYLAGQVSVLDGLNAVNFGNAFGQVTGSMAAVVGASYTGGPRAGIAMGYAMVYGDAVDAARKAGFNEQEAEYYGQIVSVGTGFLEQYGVGKLLDGWTRQIVKKSVLNVIKADIRAGVPKDVILKKVTKQVMETASKGAQQGVIEGTTEFLQEGQETVTQIAFNEFFKDKEDQGFEIPSLQQFAKRGTEAFVLGFFGGSGASVVGDAFSGTQSYSKLASSAIRDNETFNNLNLVADGLLAAGKITQQERDSFVGNLKIAKEAKAALPKYIKDDNIRQRSIELILEKKRLEADMATVDPSMQDGYRARLASIQSELKSVADQKWKAPAKAVEISTVSGLEAMTTDLVDNSSKDTSAGIFVSTVESGRGFITDITKSLDENKPISRNMADRTVAALESLAKSFGSAPVKTEITEKAAQKAQELADQIKSYSNIQESVEEKVIPGLDISLVADRIALGVPIADLDFMGDVPVDIQEAYQGIMNGDEVSSQDANNVQNVLYAKYKELSDIKQRIQDKLENTTSKDKQSKLSESINAISEIQGKLSEDISMLGRYRDETRINEEATGRQQETKTKPVVSEEVAQEETQQEPSREQKRYSEQELAEMEYDYSNPSEDTSNIIDEQPDASKIYKLLNNAIKFINKIAPNVKIYVHSTSQEFYDSVYSTSGKNEHNLSDDASFVMGTDGKPKAIHFNLETMLGKKDPKERAEAIRTFAHEAMHVGLQTIFGNDQKLFKSFQDKLSKVLASADLAFLDDFIENYRDPNKEDVTAEEFLAELGGMMSAEGRKIPKPILARIAQLINNTIVSAARTLKISVDPNLLFKNTNDTNDVIDFFNTMAESTRTGIVQGVQAKAEPLLKQQETRKEKELADKELEQQQDDEGDIDNEINDEGLFSEIDTSTVRARKNSQSLLGTAELKRFPVNKNTKVQENVPLSNFDKKRSNLIESDRMTGAYIADKKSNILYKFYGGVYYPIITGKWWASSNENTAKKIVKNGNNNRDADGYIYCTPMVGSAKQHMSNMDMLSSTVQLMKDDVKDKKSKVTHKDIEVALLKAFSRKGLLDKKPMIESIINNNKDVNKLFEEIDFILFQESASIRDRKNDLYKDANNKPIPKFSFKQRLDIVTTLLGDPKVKEIRFPTAGTITDVAKKFSDPLTANVKNIGDIVTVMRTKGTLKYKKTPKTDDFYHKSYPVEIYAEDSDGNPAEIEVFILDGAYDMTEVFPRLTKSSGGEFTWKDYTEHHNKKTNTYVRAQYNRTSKLSGASGEISVTKEEKDLVDSNLTNAIDYKKESGTTQRPNTTNSYIKAANLLKEIGADTDVLDYGAGLGLGTDAMSSTLGSDVDSYEPNPERWKGKKNVTFVSSNDIDKKYKSIVSLNVLNVVEKDIRDSIVKDIFNHLDDNGVAVISARKWNGDVNQAKNAEEGGEKNSLYVSLKQDGKQVKVFQKGFDGNELVDYISDLLGDKATVEKNNSFGATGVVIKKNAEPTTRARRSQASKALEAYPELETTQIIDENGNPLVVRHQSQSDIDITNMSDQKGGGVRNNLGRNSQGKYGIYFTTEDAESLKGMFDKTGKGKTYDVYLDVKNVLDLGDTHYFDFETNKPVPLSRDVVDNPDRYLDVRDISKKDAERITALGYDGIWGNRNEGNYKGIDEIVVFDKSKIKPTSGIEVSEPTTRARKSQPDSLKDVESTTKALKDVDTQELKKQLAIESNWDMRGEGDFLSAEDSSLSYTKRLLPDWNNASKRGDIDADSKLTYDIGRQAPIADRKLPNGLVIEGSPEITEGSKVYARDENGVTVAMAEMETLADGKYGISHIVVAPEFRGKGVGNNLLKLLKKNNPKLDLSKTKLRSEEFNKAFSNKILSEAYHKAKSDGSNPEYVQAVEDLLTSEPQSETTTRARKKVKVFRGTGNNVRQGINDAIQWVAEDRRVAENYSEGGKVEEMEVVIPSNPFEMPLNAIQVRGVDIANRLRTIRDKQLKDKVITRENALEISKYISDFEDKAGNELELYSTKTNKKESSSAFVTALKALGFDGLVQKESYNSGSPFTNTITGNETNTYGIFKEQSTTTQGTTTRARRTQSTQQYYNPAKAADQGTKADRDNQVKIYDQAKAFIDNFIASGGDVNDIQTALFIELSDNGIDIDANDLFQLRYDINQGNRPKFAENKGGQGYAQQEGTKTKKSRVLERIKTKLEKLASDKSLNRKIVNKLKDSLHYTVQNQDDAMRIAQMVVDEFGGIDGPQDVEDLFDLSNEFSGAVKTFIVGNVLNEAYKNAKKAAKGSAEQLRYQSIVNNASTLLAERARDNGREIAALYKLYLNSPEGMYTIEAKKFLQDVEAAFTDKSQKAKIDALIKELKDAKAEAARLALEVDAVRATIATATGGPVAPTPPKPGKPTTPKPPKPPKPQTTPTTPTQANLKKERSLFQQLKDRLKALGNTRARRQYPAGVDADVVDILSELARVNFERGIFDFYDIKDAIAKKLAKDNMSISDAHYTEMWNDIWREAGNAQIAFNAEILAKRIVFKAKQTAPSSAPMTDPIKLIKDELFKRATQDIKDFDVDNETEFDKLRRLLFFYGSMTKPIWNESKDAVRRQIDALDPTKYTDAAKAELRRKLDNFFNDTIANALPRSEKKITATFAEDVKSKQLKIQEILLLPNETIATNREEFVADLVDRLVSGAGVSYSDAQAITEAFTKEYDKLAQKTAEKVLARSVPRTKSKDKILKKSSAERAFEMIKYGAIDQNASLTDKDGNLTDLNDLFSDIFGLPKMNDEIRDNLKIFAEQIAKTKPNSILRQQFYNDMMSYIEFQKIRDSLAGSIILAQIYHNVLFSMDTMVKAFNSNVINMPHEFVTQAIRATFEGDFSLIPLIAKSYFGRKGEKNTEVWFKEGMNNAKLTLAGMVETENFNTTNTAEILSKQNESPALKAWGKYARKSNRFLGSIDTLFTSAATGARISDLLYDEIKYLAKQNGITLSTKQIAETVANIQGVKFTPGLGDSPVVKAIAQAKIEFTEAELDINAKRNVKLFRARVMEIVREGARDRAAAYIVNNRWASELDGARIDEIISTAKELASKVGLVGNPPGTFGVLAHFLKLPGKAMPGSQVLIGNMFANAPMNAAEKILQGNALIGGLVLLTRLFKNQRGLLNSNKATSEFYTNEGIRTEMYGRVTSTVLGRDVNMEKKEMIVRYTMLQAVLIPLSILSTNAIVGAIGKALDDDDEKKEAILKDGIAAVGRISENERHMLFFGDKTAEEGSEEFNGQWKNLKTYVTGPMYGYTEPGAYSKMSALKSMYGIEPYCVYSYGRLVTRYNDNPLLAAIFGSIGANNDVVLFNNDPEKPTETWTQQVMQSSFLQLNLVKDQAAIKPVMEIADALGGKASYSAPGLEDWTDRMQLLAAKKGGSLVSNIFFPAAAKNFNQDMKSLQGIAGKDPREWYDFLTFRVPIIENIIRKEKTDAFDFPIEEKTKRVLPVGTQGLLYVRGADGVLQFPQVDQIMNGPGGKYYAMFKKYDNDQFDKPGITSYVERDPNDEEGESKVKSLTLEQKNLVRDEYKKIMRQFCDDRYDELKSGISKMEFDLELDQFLANYDENESGYKDYILKKVIGENAFIDETIDEKIEGKIDEQFRIRD